MAENISLQDPDDLYGVHLEIGSVDSALRADVVTYLKTRLAQVPGVTYPVKAWKTESVSTEV